MAVLILKLLLPVGLILIFLVPYSAGALTNGQRMQCKKWHNYYRLMHQVARVSISTALEKKATRWANYLARNNEFKHESKDPGNLYATVTKESNPCKVAIMSFYSEEKKYNYKKPGWSAQTGHFTMMVWKSTKYIGAAWVQRRDKKWVLVIKYSPLGNDGQYAQNVFPRRVVTVKPPLTKRKITIITRDSVTWSNTANHVSGTNATRDSVTWSNTTAGVVLAKSAPLRCSFSRDVVMVGIFAIFLFL